MSARPESKKSRLLQWLDPAASPVDESRFSELRTRLHPISESYLRKLLRESGVPLAPLVEGVSLSSFEGLERTLLALSDVYGCGEHGARRLVIEAKNHLRWSESRAADEVHRAQKREMLLWVLTWLENPMAFPVWLRLRKRCAPSL